MPNLDFAVERAEVAPFTATPLLVFKLRVTNSDDGEPIQAVALCCQIRIEPAQRNYGAGEQPRLLDLFGEPQRWGRTLRSMLWTHANAHVQPCTGCGNVDLHVPCTFDFNVAATKYFYALESGEVPLTLLFSGTVFHATEEGNLRIAPIPREKEASFRLPVSIWKAMMEQHYPDTAWLCLRKDVFDGLYRYKMERGLPTWEQAVQELLA